MKTIQELYAFLSQHSGLMAEVAIKYKVNGEERQATGYASNFFQGRIAVCAAISGIQKTIYIPENANSADYYSELSGYITDLEWHPVTTVLPADVDEKIAAIENICEIGRIKGGLYKVFGVNYTECFLEDSGAIITPLYPTREMAEIVRDAHKKKITRRMKRTHGAKNAMEIMQYHRWDIVELEIVYQLK